MVLSNHWIVKITDGADIHELSKHLGLNSSESSALSFLPNTFRLENLGAQEDEFILENAKNHEHIQWIHRDTIVEYEKRAPQDEPRYGNQWHLKNTGQGGGVSGTDANVEPAWAQGVSGEGVQICIIDDGLSNFFFFFFFYTQKNNLKDHAHNDFEEKYVAEDRFNFHFFFFFSPYILILVFNIFLLVMILMEEIQILHLGMEIIMVFLFLFYFLFSYIILGTACGGVAAASEEGKRFIIFIFFILEI